MKNFKQWIDLYKKDNDWNELFNDFPAGTSTDCDIEFIAPKYHELPIAMQFGIYIEYVYHIDTKINKDFRVILYTGPHNKINGEHTSLKIWCKREIPKFFEYIEDLL
jgi:hypothetical protein